MKSRPWGRTKFRSPSYPRFDYRASPLYPHQMAGNWGMLTIDAISGNYYPAIYTALGPFGPVDGRDGAVLDLDVPEHEAAITMVGSMAPPRYGPVNPEN